MARKKLIEAEATNAPSISILDEVIDSYGTRKASLDELTKLCKDSNAEIKKLLKELVKADKDGKYIRETPLYKATLSTQDRSTLNEDKLLEFLKKKYNKAELKAMGLIKTKEYVDSDALESAIYNERIDAATVVEMEVCKDVSIVETLKVSRVKKGDK